jgi:conjugal transfer pilus assembly protein TraB
MRMPASIKNAFGQLKPQQRQIVTLIAIVAAAIGLLWAVFAATDSSKPGAPTAPVAGQPPGRVTNVEVMPGGAQVTPADRWIGDAGRKLAQYEKEKEEQAKLNNAQQEFRTQTFDRFTKLEEALRGNQAALAQSPSPPPPGAAAGSAAPMYPAQPLPPPPQASRSGVGLPVGSPGSTMLPPPETGGALVRVSLADPTAQPQKASDTPPPAANAPAQDGDLRSGNVDTFLPVSFTRGVLLGGLDAPTGGQSQSNPHPVLIRLDDAAVLPNGHRSDIKECFVVAAGYGEISSERAYLRTETLSCVRSDGSTLEVAIKGVVYGEDGKVGMRGRLVTKQGQMLANALLAGIVSGIGQGFGQRDTTYSSSALGTVGTTSGEAAMRQGLGSGVGRALDRLAGYYIKLAEQTFPVIEVDAGRVVDVVITKGTRINGGEKTKERPAAHHSAGDNPGYTKVVEDDDY